MQEPMLRLNGVNENLQIRILTKLNGADVPQRVQQAMHTLFPEFPIPPHQPNPSLGNASDAVWEASDVSLEHFLKSLHEQRILDTALDAMTVQSDGTATTFYLLRQAAIVGKVAFALAGEVPLGGLIQVDITGDHLHDWLEAATWHKGRDTVPRGIQDESAMGKDGTAVTWIQ